MAGCVNLDLAENKGLKDFIVPKLAPVYGATDCRFAFTAHHVDFSRVSGRYLRGGAPADKYKAEISYADFIVLAANVAINAASGGNVVSAAGAGAAVLCDS